MSKFSGASTAATGTISSSTASLLSFAATRKRVIVSNRSGQVCYCKLNDAAAPTVSTTVYDFVLSDAGVMVIDDMAITNVSVYVAATSGVRAVGW
jgi:hypothetical protein